MAASSLRSRRVAALGASPAALLPVAARRAFRAGVVACDRLGRGYFFVWEREACLAHRGPRQPARRPDFADFVATRERVRFAPAKKAWHRYQAFGAVFGHRAVRGSCDFAQDDTGGSASSCAERSAVAESTPATSPRRKREASALPASDAISRSVRTAPKLSSPSTGRDTPPLPTANAPTSRVGRGLDRRLALRSRDLMIACTWWCRARPAGTMRCHVSSRPPSAASPRRQGEPESRAPAHPCRTRPCANKAPDAQRRARKRRRQAAQTPNSPRR